MNIIRRGLLKRAVTVLGLWLVLLPAARHSDGQDLVAAAKKEGEVTFYTAVPQVAADSLANAFKAKYGINVNVYRTDSVRLVERILTEVRANKVQLDVAFTDVIDSIGLAAQGLLLPWDPPARAGIAAEHKKPEYTTVRMFCGAIAWNTNLVKPSDAPRTWQDLLNPKWRGRLGIDDPSTTIIAVQMIDMVDKLYGKDFLEKLRENNPRIYPTVLPVGAALAAGEIAVGHVIDYVIAQAKEKGAPVDGVIPEPTYCFGAAVGVMRQAPHPSAAKLFYDFAVSAEGLTALVTPIRSMSTRPDVKVPGAYSITDIKKVYASDPLDLKRRQGDIRDEFNRRVKGQK